MRVLDTRLPRRFWDKIEVTESGCWRWVAGHSGDGYAAYAVHGRMTRAHRTAYEVLTGPIPFGLELDHLCRVLDCVNPAHLEPVTRRENNLRWMRADGVKAGAATCIRGHAFTEANTDRRDGRRRCRECRRTRDRERYASSRKSAA